MANAYSDSLVVEASGGEAAAKLYKQRDENGFRASEVGYALLILLWSYLVKTGTLVAPF